MSDQTAFFNLEAVESRAAGIASTEKIFQPRNQGRFLRTAISGASASPMPDGQAGVTAWIVLLA